MSATAPETYLSWSEAKPRFGNVSRTTVWRGVNRGFYPAPVAISPGRKAWTLSAILDWQSQRSPGEEVR